jgi:hypothetical protein
MTEEMYQNLTKLESYLQLSYDLENIYQDNKDKFTSFDEENITNLGSYYVPLTDEELNTLIENVSKITNNDSNLSYDERMQLIANVLEYTPRVNAFLNFEGYKILKDTLITSIVDDIAISSSIDSTLIEPSYNEEDNKYEFSRCGINDKYGYVFDTDGIVMNYLNKSLSTIDNAISTRNDFLSSTESMVSKKDNFYSDDYSTVLLWNNGNIYTYYNKKVNKELNNYLGIIKLLFFESVKVEDDSFKYSFNSDESLYDTLSYVKTLSK